jgi:hypothetical protein
MALLPLLFADTPDVDHVRCMKIGLVMPVPQRLRPHAAPLRAHARS